MASLYDVSAEAQNDLFEIWQRIAEDSLDLANRIENEFYDLFATLGRMPGQGHIRRDLTKRQVLFFPLYSFLVVYQPDVKPIRIMAVVRGKRNLKHLLKERFRV
jgi:plasmid stabilization system protein ParE